MYSRGGEMLIFGHWLDCLLDGFNLQKNDVAIFWAIPCSVFTNLKFGLNCAKEIDYGTPKTT